MAPMPLAMSLAAEIDAVMPLIADQSILSALLCFGCVGTPIVAKTGADTNSAQEAL